MVPEVRQALLTVEVDERELLPLLGAGGWACVAAAGIVVHRIAGMCRRDRKLLRSWLSHAEVGAP